MKYLIYCISSLSFASPRISHSPTHHPLSPLTTNMKTTFATLLATLALATTGVFSVPVSEHEAHQAPGPDYGPGYGVQPGYGPNPAPNPVGLFGLKRNNQAYHALCDQHSASAKHDHRARACFDTQLVLESISLPQALRGCTATSMDREPTWSCTLDSTLLWLRSCRST